MCSVKPDNYIITIPNTPVISEPNNINTVIVNHVEPTPVKVPVSIQSVPSKSVVTSKCLFRVLIIYYSTCALLLFICPFVVLDLYYAYNTNDCINQDIQNVDIRITLKTWLLVDGYVLIFGIFMGVIHIIILSCCRELVSCFKTVIRVTSTFSMCWVIVASIMFWHYLEPNKMCNHSLNTYLWVRLIMGLVGSCISHLRSRKTNT